MPILVIILILVFLLLLLAFCISLYIESSQKKSILGGLESALFLVMMPSESPKKEGESPKEEKPD